MENKNPKENEESKETPEYSKLEIQVVNELRNKHMSDYDLKKFLNGIKSTPQLSTSRNIRVDKSRVKYGVISDTHMGSIYYDPKLMRDAANTFKRRNVDFVIHVGDVLEGHYEGRRHGSVFELSHIGADNQINYAVDQLKQITDYKPLYFITGNHENNTFYKSMGFEVGKHLEEKLGNATFLGNAEGEIELPHNQKILLLHPDGGSSYAVSYKSQKIAESLEGGKKPAILHLGHFHKAEYMFYRNIHIIQSATLQSQTKFMKGRHLSAHKGYFVLEADVSNKGILRIKPEFYPEY